MAHRAFDCGPLEPNDSSAFSIRPTSRRCPVVTQFPRPSKANSTLTNKSLATFSFVHLRFHILAECRLSASNPARIYSSAPVSNAKPDHTRGGAKQRQKKKVKGKENRAGWRWHHFTKEIGNKSLLERLIV